MTYQRFLLTGFSFLALWLFCATPVKAEQSFSDWLESFQAYDVLESELSRKNASPETLLHRANLALQAGDPEKALHILERHGPYPDKANEASRIWSRARVLRFLGRQLEALFAYSKGAKMMADGQKKHFFESEPGLLFFWKNTIKKWIFEHCFNGRIQANAGQKSLLLQAAGQAKSVWDRDGFWVTVKSALSGKQVSAVESSDVSVLSVDSASKQMVVQAMAGLSIEDRHYVQNSLKEISVPEVRRLWAWLLSELYNRDLDPMNAEEADPGSGYPKFAAFQQVFLPRIKDLGKEAWQIEHPEIDSWKAFTDGLNNTPLERALAIIDNELNSVLLNKEVKEILEQYHFSYALMNDRRDLAKEVWPRLEKSALPLSLKISGILLGLGTIEACFPDQQEQQRTRKLLVSTLTGATGLEPSSGLQLPFWIRPAAGSATIAKIQSRHPLDMLLAYAVASQKWNKAPSAPLAKESALLFAETSLGSKSLLYLARNAYEEGQTQKAWGYLQHMEPKTLSRKEQVEYLQAKGGLLMDLGRVDDSLKTYQHLLSSYPLELSAEKKLKLALLSQRRGNWKWAQETLQDLWEEHRSLEPGLQAEIMFWLGEGAQKSGKDLEALKYYLRLAWEFPEENIWAVTALYRSALIYEQQGELRAARNLFRKVLQKADRKSQKKAAKDRIEAIEKRLHSNKTQEPEVTFLF
ncbi:MAG: tetratricopeptide repeat protein [Desulfohalobiaceae bacterium]|nr:tetratricopeptide repeat protein [Desulfohalobiaceae bacterium]